MIKFILHGGGTSLPTQENKRFFSEIVKGLPDPVEILLVYFAQEKERWLESFEIGKERFSSALPERDLEFVLADINKDKFIQQIKSADAVYIHGGNTLLLKQYLSKIENLEKLLQGKVVAGSSAGANVFAKYHFSNSRKRVEEDLGILPIKVHCHHKGEKEKIKKLKETGEDLKIYTIPEGKYYIVNKK